MFSNRLKALLLATLIWLFAAQAWAAITMNAVGRNQAFSGTTVVVTPGTVASGNLVIATVYDFSLNVTSPTMVDSKGNTYTKLVSSSFTSGAVCTGGAGSCVLVFYSVLGTGISAADTITYTSDGTSISGRFVNINYATAIRTTSPADTAVTNVAANFGTTVSVTSAGTATVSGDLTIGFACNNSGNAETLSAGWTALPTTSQAGGCLGGYQINSGTGTLTYAPTWTGAAVAQSAIVAFMPPVVIGLTRSLMGVGS